jgi:uncharacterized protein (DUF433 family)
MWTLLEPWQITQLQRLAAHDAERVETVLNTLWRQYPGLLEELAISAVDQEELGVEECASLLRMDIDAVNQRLAAFRKRAIDPETTIVLDDLTSVARLSEGQVAVWEVVREYRKLGSVERLASAFPGLTEPELAAALKYADGNPEEIEALILRYEEALTRRRSEYPYAR